MPDMDEDTRELTAQLCTRVGMIMEDASVVALTAGSLAPEEQHEALRQLRSAALTIEALICAAIRLAEEAQ